jgi:chloride channel 3/4/5
MTESKGSIYPDDRVWYDQFTSTDWVHDTIADSHRVKALRSRKDFIGRLRVLLDGSQGWILSALSGFLIALVAYVVNVSEVTVFDFKDGYCSRRWFLSEKAGHHCVLLASAKTNIPWALEMLSERVLRRMDELV